MAAGFFAAASFAGFLPAIGISISFCPAAALRRNAIRALGEDAAAQALFFGAGVIADKDPTTRLAALVKLAEFPTAPEIKTLVRGLALVPRERLPDGIHPDDRQRIGSEFGRWLAEFALREKAAQKAAGNDPLDFFNGR